MRRPLCATSPSGFRRVFRIAFVFLMVSLKSAAGDGEEPARDVSAEFSEIVQKSAMRLQEASEKRSFRLKYMNDSLTKTAEAAMALARKENPERVRFLLNEARGNYGENYFTYLFEAILAHGEKDGALANKWLENFLVKSRAHTQFEQAFIQKDEMLSLRETVYAILQSRGVEVDWGRRKRAGALFFKSFFGFILALLILWGTRAAWQAFLKPPPPGFRRCPHCFSVIEKLRLECPKCRRRS